MNTDYAALALVVDRSGSMEPIASDVRGSVKNFIGEQKKNSGKASFTLVQFDDRYDEVHKFVDLQSVDGDKFANDYSPRGSTALLDAIGRTTLEMSQKLESMPQEERPKRVVIAVITDGQENASKEFKIEQIKEMIKSKEALGWDFVFMGATLDTIEVAKNLGFAAGKSAVYSTSEIGSCMDVLSQQVTNARSNKAVHISESQRNSLVKSCGVSFFRGWWFGK